MNLVKSLTNLKLRYQHWYFSRKYVSVDKRDLNNQLKAIEKARRLSLKRKTRLWVVRLFPGKYRICTKADIKGILRNNGISTKTDIYQIDQVVVHVTKYGK